MIPKPFQGRRRCFHAHSGSTVGDVLDPLRVSVILVPCHEASADHEDITGMELDLLSLDYGFELLNGDDMA